MHDRRQHRFASAALILSLVVGYVIFSTDAATCLEHTVSAHHHAGPTAHHHALCGETQCSAAAIVTDGLSAPADLPRLCGAVVLPAVSPVDLLFLSFASSRGPPPALS
jgi:uncharacterized low-complexity protein